MAILVREVEETEENEELMSVVKEDTPLLGSATGVSKERFVILSIMVANFVFAGIQVITLAPVNNIAAKYYEVSSVQVEWLSNTVTICSFASLPWSYFVGSWGIRRMMLITGFLNLLSTALQYTGYQKDLFALVMASRVPYGIAYAAIAILPAKISAIWFAKHERATATAVILMSNAAGVTIGNLLSGYMIKEGDSRAVEENLKKYYMVLLILASFLFLSVFFFKEKPRLPPSLSCGRETIGFLESIKTLLGNKNSLIMMHSFVLLTCVIGTSNVLANPLITSTFHTGYEKYIGLTGAISSVLAVISIVITGILLDKYQRYKLLSIVVTIINIVTWLCFFVVLTNTKNLAAVMVLNVVFGAFVADYNVLFFEAASETFYPIPEELIGMISNVVSTPYVFLANLGLGVAIKEGQVQLAGYLIFALCLLQLCLVALMKVDKKRSREDATLFPRI